jgi:hypothetical protein
MEHGKYCCVVGASDHPDFNGDGDIEIKTTSGRLYM